MKKLFLLFTVLLGANVHAQWTQLVSGTTKTLQEIFFPVPDTGFVVGDSGTVLRTFDGGTTWAPLNPGTIKSINDIYFLNSQTGFIVGDSGFFAKTTNAGTTWNSTYISNPDPIDLGCVYFTDTNTGYVGGTELTQYGGIILRTANGGTTWMLTNTPTAVFSINYQRLDFPSPDTGYALTRGICVKTVDAGNNWFVTDTALVASGNMFSILQDCYFFSPDTGYIVGWYGGFSGYTFDGYNWYDQLIGNNQWYAVDFPSRQTGYMLGWGSLYKTTNGGQGWWDVTTPLITTAPALYSMDFTDNNTGYACGDFGFIMKTTNGATNGMDDEQLKTPLTIFPNPFSEKCTVRFPELIQQGTLTITDVVGRTVREIAVSNSLEVSIGRNELQAGIYFLHLRSPQGDQVSKIVLE
jgi:photosystem II stability/assembly factor-like uncharacterized protein